MNQLPANSELKYAHVGRNYGYGCQLHDTYGTECTSSNADWCADRWCIVNPNNCVFKTRPVSYTSNTGDFFSYETCNSNFNGNSWVGRCRCASPYGNSFCQCGTTGVVNTGIVNTGTVNYGGSFALNWIGTDPSILSYCQGDCDNDASCPAGSTCVQRTNGVPVNVPGCSVGDSTVVARRDTDYCSNPGTGIVNTGVVNTGVVVNTGYSTGSSGCPCVINGVNQQPANSELKYAHVGRNYGYGCQTHDSYGTECTSSAADWCADQWCIVDKNNCNFKTRKVSYTSRTDDYFSYETCNSNFNGNSWVGTCKCKSPHGNSFCKCGTDEVADHASHLAVGYGFALSCVFLVASLVA